MNGHRCRSGWGHLHLHAGMSCVIIVVSRWLFDHVCIRAYTLSSKWWVHLYSSGETHGNGLYPLAASDGEGHLQRVKNCHVMVGLGPHLISKSPIVRTTPVGSANFKFSCIHSTERVEMIWYYFIKVTPHYSCINLCCTCYFQRIIWKKKVVAAYLML